MIEKNYISSRIKFISMRKVLFYIGMFLFVIGVNCLLLFNIWVLQNSERGLVASMSRFEFVMIADAIVGAILVSLNMPKKEE